MTVYKSILDYAIPEHLVAAGLAPPGSAPPLPVVPPPPQGPPLPAVLPSVGPTTTGAPRAPTCARPPLKSRRPGAPAPGRRLRP